MRKSLVLLVLLVAVLGVGLAAAMPHNQFVPAGMHKCPVQSTNSTTTNSTANTTCNATCPTCPGRMEMKKERKMENCTCGNATNATRMRNGMRNNAGNGTMGTMERVMEKNAGANRELRIKIEERIKRAGGFAGIEEAYVKAKMQYIRLKHEYMKLKMEGKLDFSHEKKFCMVAGNLVLRWFDRMEAAILNSNLNETLKDQLVAKLEQEKIAFEQKLRLVNETENPEQLKQVVRELREQWMESRRVVSEVAEEVAIAKLERVINVAERLGDKLSELAPNSTLLTDYNAKVQQAKSLIEDAKSKVSTDVIAAREDIKEAVRLLREAFIDARQIVREVNMHGMEISGMHRHGMNATSTNASTSTGLSTGQLNVMGNGTFEFTGSGVVVVTATNATITYTGELVNVTGFTAVNGTLTGSGKATFRGNVTVKVSGENVHLFVKGEGKAYLSGTGVYMYKNVAQQRIQREELNGSVEVTIGGES